MLKKRQQSLTVASMRQILVNCSRFGFGRSACHIIRVIRNAKIIISLAAPDIPRGFSLAAVTGGIIGFRITAAEFQHHALRGIHCCFAVGIAGKCAFVQLVCGGIHHIVGVAGALFHHPDGIGTRSDRLCLQRFQWGTVAHFVWENAVEVIFHLNMSHRHQSIAAIFSFGTEGEICRIGIATGELCYDGAIRNPMTIQGKVFAHIPTVTGCRKGHLTGGGIAVDFHLRTGGKWDLTIVHGIAAVQLQRKRARIPQRG